MADEVDQNSPEGLDHEAASTSRPLLMRIARWIGAGALVIAVIFAGFLAFLHTSPGRQFVIDEIAELSPTSGLQVEVGSIDGSILWSSSLNEVKLRDAEDTLFLEIPRIDLSWRPLSWLTSGLDIRHLVVSQGKMLAVPVLKEGDPDAPILPDFDIRIDRLVVENLIISQDVMGEERMVSLAAKSRIRDGLVFADLDGEFGGSDVFSALIHASPDKDEFDLDIDWRAPKGGLLAAITGADEDMSLTLKGEGSWSDWDGTLLAKKAGGDLLDFDLSNRAGTYALQGQFWPRDYVEGIAGRALGEAAALNAIGTFEDNGLDGEVFLRGEGIEAQGSGQIHLSNNSFEDFDLTAKLLNTELFGENFSLGGAQISAQLNGEFRDLAMRHELQIGALKSGAILASDLIQKGEAQYDGARFTIPLDLKIGAVTSGNDTLDPHLTNGTLRGELIATGSELLSNNLAVQFAKISAQLQLASRLETGRTQLSGPVSLNAFPLANFGLISGKSEVDFTIGGGTPWALLANVKGNLSGLSNESLATVTGGNVGFAGSVSLGGDRPIAFDQFAIAAPNLQAQLQGQVEGETTTLKGQGRHSEYGPFDLTASFAKDGPRGELLLANPYPAAGLADVRLSLAPQGDGLAIDTRGTSLLGDFSGAMALLLPQNAPAQLQISRFDIARSRLAGNVTLGKGALIGALDISGGGLDGILNLTRRESAQGAARQGFGVQLTARNAQFTGDTPISIARGALSANGVFGEGHQSITGNSSLMGVRYGEVFIGRLNTQARIANGVGVFDASLTGSRDAGFSLALNGAMSKQQISLAAKGNYAGRELSMPRRALLIKQDDGAWHLQPAQLSYGSGIVLANGSFGGDSPMRAELDLANMPMELIGGISGVGGLGGTISGELELGTGVGDLPIGKSRLLVENLTRSSSLFTSRPLTIALVSDLSEGRLQARAVMSNSAGEDGRLEAQIANLPRLGTLAERLKAGNLRGKLDYNGSSSALWRLTAVDLLDVSGDVILGATLSGKLTDPQLRGTLAGDDLRVQSPVTGSDITNTSVRGTFTGTRINLTRFAGKAAGGGDVSGSGFIDMSRMGGVRGPQIDLRIALSNARVLDRNIMGATVSGPLRIVSNGVGGTLAGRFTVGRARWRLGRADVEASLPRVNISEINMPLDIAPLPTDTAPWRYMINAVAEDGISVDGLGLDSEWSGDIQLRGTTADPRIGGEVRVVPRRSYYEFAGIEFDITKGRISFDETQPLDPSIDLLAESEVNSLAVAVTIQGSASRPEIAFSSTPSLPDEELLAQMLFGGSITELSATDAIQLGAAMAALRDGSGLGPINRLRNAVGLDRLRLISADPALDRGTSVALGKNITRNLYGEIITDGADYSATEVEYRVTSWLSLLASISTVGRNSVAAQVRRDY